MQGFTRRGLDIPYRHVICEIKPLVQNPASQRGARSPLQAQGAPPSGRRQTAHLGAGGAWVTGDARPWWWVLFSLCPAEDDGV